MSLRILSLGRDVQRMKGLSPQEKQFLTGLLKEHLDYYRTLAGNSNCSAANREKLVFLERLVAKLNNGLTKP